MPVTSISAFLPSPFASCAGRAIGPASSAGRGGALQATRLALLCGALAMGATGMLAAQDDGGLKLGGPDDEPTLDLGAPADAPADAPTPTAPAPEQPSGQQGEGGAASAPPEITPHGDWDVACAPGGGGSCIMTQEGADAEGNPALRIMIERLAEPQEVEDQTVVAVIDIVTPLGVVLNVGLALTVDDGETSRAPFQICTVEGCLVREPVTEEVINRLRRGSNTEIGFVVANFGEVASDISLKGFTAAYKSLE